MFNLKQIWNFEYETLRSFVSHSLDLIEINDLRIGTAFVLASPDFLSEIEIQIVKHTEFISTFKNYDFDIAYQLIEKDIESFSDFKSIPNKKIKYFTDKLKLAIKYINNYIILKKLGKGSFGSVTLCIDIQTFKRVVIKYINKTSNNIPFMKNEVMVLKKVADIGLTPAFIECIETSGTIYIVTEYISNMITLRKYINLHTFGDCTIKTNIELTKNLIEQLVDMNEKLVINGIIHGDVKPDNILICLDDFKLYFIDFGCSIISNELEINTPFICTKIYFPPSFFISMYGPDKIKINFKGYISAQNYAFGTTIITLLNGEEPFVSHIKELETRNKLECDSDKYFKYDFNNDDQNFGYKCNCLNIISNINKLYNTNYDICKMMKNNDLRIVQLY